MSELRPGEDQLASWPAQRIDGNELRFTLAGGWQVPQPVSKDTAVTEASPQSAAWPNGPDHDDRRAGYRRAGYRIPDDQSADRDVDGWGDDGRDAGERASYDRNAAARGAVGQVSTDMANDDRDSDAETESWWPGLRSRWNSPSDTIELDLKSGWAALGFDTSEHGIQPIATFESTTTRKKGRPLQRDQASAWLGPGRPGGVQPHQLRRQPVCGSLAWANAVRRVQPRLRDVLVRAQCLPWPGHRSAARQVQRSRAPGLATRGDAAAPGRRLPSDCWPALACWRRRPCCTARQALAFLAIGLTMPGLMLQDSWRYAFFALGRGGQAFLNDTIWGLVLVPGLLYLRVSHNDSVFWFILVWGSAATVAAAAGPLQARVIPRLSDAWKWVSENRDLAFRYLAVNTSNSGSAQLRAYGLGGLVGLAAVGYIQAANLLMGPFLVVLMGISLVTVPEAARVLRNSPRHLRLYCLVLSVAVAVAALAWSGAILVLLPRGLGHLVLRRPMAADIAAGGAADDRHHGPVLRRWRSRRAACAGIGRAERPCAAHSVGYLRDPRVGRGGHRPAPIWRFRGDGRQRRRDDFCRSAVVVAPAGGVAGGWPELAGGRGRTAPSARSFQRSGPGGVGSRERTKDSHVR